MHHLATAGKWQSNSKHIASAVIGGCAVSRTTTRSELDEDSKDLVDNVVGNEWVFLLVVFVNVVCFWLLMLIASVDCHM